MADDTIKTESTPAVEAPQETPTAPTATETPEKVPEVENASKEAPKPDLIGKKLDEPERNPDGTLKAGGPSLNPNGRPKGSLAFKTAIEKWADKEAAVLPDGSKVTRMELITKKLVELAESGNVKAIEMIADRIDGKPKQSIDMTSLGERMGIDPAKQSLVNEAVRDMFKKE